MLTVRGEIDMANAGAFAETGVHLAPNGQRLIIDLANVTFMDSIGLRALLRIHTAAPDTLVLRSPGQMVQRLLSLTVQDLFTIE